jgi:exosome complex component RRP41
MAYKRLDKRKLDETRPIEAKVGIIKRADGSAMFKIGETIAYAAVYGPRSMFPRFLQNPQKGTLRVNYNMMPFSGHGDRVRPGPSRRSKEISMVTQKALLPVVDLKDFPNAVVDVFIELPQTDAGTRCAGICAASMALADAGIKMKDLVASVAVGVLDGTVVADMNYDEEAHEGEVADIPVAVLPNSGKISLLQMDGLNTKENLGKALELAKKVCMDIYEIQKKALKEKFTGESK